MTSTTTTDAREVATSQVFCKLSRYRSTNEAVSRLPEFTHALSNAHAKWAELFAK